MLIAVMRAGSRWSWSMLALVVGCAAGVESPMTTTFGPAPASGAPTSGSDSEGATFNPGDDDPSAEDPSADVGPSDSTGSFDETTTGFDETTTGFGDETTGDSGPAGNCTNMTTCQAAGSIGTVSGDQSSPNLAASGSEPTWLEFQVTEDDDSLVGAGMSFTATLTSPAGANFDLYVYRGVEGGASGCNGFAQQSTGAGAQDQVQMSWGEGVVPNGLDDSVWVAVEIRAKDDMCAPPQEWSLTVAGN